MTEFGGDASKLYIVLKLLCTVKHLKRVCVYPARSFSFSPSPKHIFEVFVEYVNTSGKEKPLGKLKLLTWLLLLLDIIDPKILQTFPKDYEWDEVR